MKRGKKTMRHFYCRDLLWDRFEQLAVAFNCSIDFLINEAMITYARSHAALRPTPRPARSHRPPPPPRRRPPPLAVGSSSGGQAGQPSLLLLFDGREIAIEKDPFIIGRGSHTCDLAIKDGNISRKHAAVIRHNGAYYIKDLQSTNGVDFAGSRIDNKRIEDGDVFKICDHELRFGYRR